MEITQKHLVLSMCASGVPGGMDQVHMPMAARMAGLGHSSANMTMHYTHGDMDDQRKAAEAMAGMLATGVIQ